MPPRRSTLALALVTLAGSGCADPSSQTACTLIGCQSGLSIQVRGAIPEGATITLDPADPSGLAVSVSCTAAEPCASPIFVPDFTPDAFEVRVSGPGIDLAQTFEPAWEVSRPNGPDCPPECRTATIVLDAR